MVSKTGSSTKAPLPPLNTAPEVVEEEPTDELEATPEIATPAVDEPDGYDDSEERSEQSVKAAAVPEDKKINPATKSKPLTASPRIDIGTNEAVVEKEMTRRYDVIKEALSKQEKVMVMIPPVPNEPEAAAWLPVTINGYTLLIKKGVMVKVPQQVAEIIAESQNLTFSADQIMGVNSGKPIAIGASDKELE